MLNELSEDSDSEKELDDSNTELDYIPSDTKSKNDIITYLCFCLP